MENSTITLLIRYFDILATTVMAFFAIYGLIAVFGKKSNLNIFRRYIFIQAFCVAAVFAFVLEFTLFNFPYYLNYLADGELHTMGVSPQDSTVILTSDGTVAEVFHDKVSATATDSTAKSVSDGNALAETSFKEKDDSTTITTGVVFKNVDRKVVSIFVEPVFDTSEYVAAKILYIDAVGDMLRNVVFYRGLPHTYYIMLQSCGKVSEIKIALIGAKSTGASKIAINIPIPFYFSGLRLIVVSLLFFALILFVYKPLRAKVAYFLFECKFDPSSKRQNVVYALSVVSLILFSWICAYTSITENEAQPQQYNRYLVDAIVAGRTNLEAGNPEKMLKAERPYNLRWLEENGYKRDVDWMSDWIYYNGKFYCYFGAVPALMLYVPYNLITGDYLSNHGGIWVFAAISIILLASLWRFFVKKYMPNARLAFYLLSFLTLFFASGWFCPIRFTRFYSIVSAAGFMFVIAGILLLFESVENERLDRSKLVLACACLALSVGCRPTLIFASLIVPVILWKYKLWKYIPLMAVPYIAVAVPMCIYNYVRFGSILDFGFNYNMTNLNAVAYSALNPLGKVLNTMTATLSYLFMMNKYSIFFPYVESIKTHESLFWQITRFYDRGYGMINFPIVFCLFFFFKSVFIKGERPKTFYISAAFLSIALVLILANSWLAGFSGRYSFDFAVFVILPSLFCAYYWCNGGSGAGGVPTSADQDQIPIKVRLKVTYVLLAFSIFVGLFLFATTVTNEAMPGNPSLYYYLRQSLIFLGVV